MFECKVGTACWNEKVRNTKFAELKEEGMDPPTSLAALILYIKKAVS